MKTLKFIGGIQTILLLLFVLENKKITKFLEKLGEENTQKYFWELMQLENNVL